MRLKHIVSDRLANIRISGGRSLFGAEVIDRLNREGLFRVDGFLERDTCLGLVQRFAALESQRPELIAHESNGADARIYGIDRVESSFRLEEETAPLDALASCFYRTRKVPHFEMVGHISSRPDNLGSGSGWHRDSPFQHQFKFIIYLGDVTEENGPFQFIERSHYRDTIQNMGRHLGRPVSQHRFADDEIASLQAAGILKPTTTVTGGAGTLLVANVKGLHRGKPLLSGERWALTRYYYRKRIPDSMRALLPC